MHNSKDFARHNTITKGQNGMHKINCTNAFDVFGKIPGTQHIGNLIAMNFWQE